jgi:rhodanese-related sulfurtransferase
MRRIGRVLAVLVAGASIAAAEGKRGWTEMTPGEVAKAIEAGTATVIDVNPAEVHAKNHLPGAIHAEPADYPQSLLGEDKGRRLVFYCANPESAACRKGADRALGFGFRNVAIMPAGIEG